MSTLLEQINKAVADTPDLSVSAGVTIRDLLPAAKALRKKGYQFRQIARILVDAGAPFTENSLATKLSKLTTKKQS